MTHLYSKAPTPAIYETRTAQKLEYEVLHHRNWGYGQTSALRIGTFATLHEAQHRAQVVLRSALDWYRAYGWEGYYHNQIDLRMQGLITGRVHTVGSIYASEPVYEWLSEFHINAIDETFSIQRDSANRYRGPVPDNYSDPSDLEYDNTYNIAVAANNVSPSSASPSTLDHIQTYTHLDAQQPTSTQSAVYSFSQSRPSYPNRTITFIPRTNSAYDETMTFSPHQPTAPSETEPADPREADEAVYLGNALGGGYDIGETYQGRRHSATDMPVDDASFQMTVQEYPQKQP
jgi:hypothetical protein